MDVGLETARAQLGLESVCGQKRRQRRGRLADTREKTGGGAPGGSGGAPGGSGDAPGGSRGDPGGSGNALGRSGGAPGGTAGGRRVGK